MPNGYENSKLHQAIEKFGVIPVAERNKDNVASSLEASYKEGLLNSATLFENGLIKPPVTDSYGRGLLEKVEGIKVPEASELLVVSLLPGYASAVHDHSADTAGANLLAASGNYFNVDYRFEDDVLKHSAIQKVQEGDTSFVPGGRDGIHRVVNYDKEKIASTVNVYWSNDGKGRVNTDAYVFNFNLGEGKRVTSGGPAFFFTEGNDEKTDLKSNFLTQLEDLVFQHLQLKTAKEEEQLLNKRAEVFNNIGEFVKGFRFGRIVEEATKEAKAFVQAQKEEDKDVATEYFQELFRRAKDIQPKVQVPNLTEVGRNFAVAR